MGDPKSSRGLLGNSRRSLAYRNKSIQGVEEMVEAKVYSASYCPWCDKAVEFLKKFEELDVWIVDVTDNQELKENF